MLMKPTSKRTRKRHVQQELFRPRGAKRKRAGRKPKGARAGARHQKRPVVKPQNALHVVMRVVPAGWKRAGSISVHDVPSKRA